jgi:hypothetical protein
VPASQSDIVCAIADKDEIHQGRNKQELKSQCAVIILNLDAGNDIAEFLKLSPSLK